MKNKAKREWKGEALLNKVTNTIKVVYYENESARLLYPLILKNNKDYEIIQVTIKQSHAKTN